LLYRAFAALGKRLIKQRFGRIGGLRHRTRNQNPQTQTHADNASLRA
jgi:hypothetical protein